MKTQTIPDNRERLERIWASEREHVRRMLIGLTRDIDLADDLLQETYLKALNGISRCRGDNDRAWLSTIARNLFFCHLRHRCVQAEIVGNDEAQEAKCSSVGTPDRLELIQIRHAISELNPGLRAALLMKHYCGFTYKEIAENTHCAVGTAKWRVSMAIGKLKEAIGVVEEMIELTCADLGRTRMLDYLYKSMPADETEAMDRHLRNCSRCRGRLDGTRKILSALDALEGDLKHMHIIELDERGKMKLYSVMRSVNTSDQLLEELQFVTGKGGIIECLVAQGEELQFVVEEEHDWVHYPNTYKYTARLPQPIAPGKSCDYMIVFPPPRHTAEKKSDDCWTFDWSQLTSVEREYVFVLALRLPAGAHVVSTNPPASESRSGTLLWRSVQPANERFYCDAKYRLRDKGGNDE